MCSQYQLEVINLVAGGDVRENINLEKLMSIELFKFEYDPETFPGASLKIKENDPNILVFSSGKFTIQGARNKKQATEYADEFIRILDKNNLIQKEIDLNIEVVNLVCTLDIKKSLNLDELAIEGLEGETEYMPEQTPYVVYRPSNFDCVFTISKNGKCVVNGLKKFQTVEKATNHLIKQLKY
jgi:transcription initiation factor TFIID TATA-box-binding protein